MTEAERELYDRIIAADRERLIANPPPPRAPTEPPTIHFSELPAAEPDSRGATEWNFYRRVVGQLLADGHEGRWVLITGEAVVGVWDTEDEPRRVAAERYPLQDVLVHRLLAREPVLRTPTFFYRPRCHN
ncbi:MAG: hypothetical protein K2V38_09000 [Gemmataceae bacterium]|nr:hypothetical protein [Gemmataceae bacterium]